MNSIGRSFSEPMPMPLSERLLQRSVKSDAARENAPASFPDLLASGVTKVNSMQQDATAQVHELLTGGDVNQTEVFTAVQKADMAFRMLVQIRNKLMSAYEEINNIRI